MSSRKQAALPQKSSRQIKRRVILNQNKGLNNLVSPSLIDDREFSQLQNMEYDEGGVIRKRSGTTQVLGDLTSATGLGFFSNETNRQVITIDDGAFKYTTTGTWTTDGSVSFSSSAIPDFAQIRDKLYIWDGDGGGAEWDGSTLSRPGTMPKAKFSIFYQDRNFAAGVTGQPNRLYISASDDASMFTRSTSELNNSTEVPGATVFSDSSAPLADFIDIQKNDGDEIKGLQKFQDVLLIFKERSIFQLTLDDSGNPTVQLITASTGAVGHKSIESVENDVYFLSREGIRVIGNEPNYFTSIRTNLLSIRIQNTIDSINAEYYDRCIAHYFDNKYLLSVPTSSSTTPDTTIVYDRRFQAWSIWKNYAGTGFIKYVDSANAEFLYHTDSGGAKVVKLTPGTYNDDNQPIEAFVVSKAYDDAKPDLTKVYPDIGLVFRRVTGQIDITIYQDGGVQTGSTTLTQGAVDGMGLLPLGMQTLGLGTGETAETSIFVDDPFRVVLNLTSKTIKYKLYNNRINENFVLLGTIIAWYPYTHFLFDSSKKLYI